MVVTWIGHASTLVQTQGLNILIDPIFEERPFMIFGHRRVREPGVRLHDLPPIDLVLVSHDHYDHLELSTLRYLQQRDHPLIVTALGNDDIMAAGGVSAIARDWGGRVNVRPGIDVVLTRAHHWSRRWLGPTDQALWTGFRVTLPGGDLYYSGDTGPGDMKWATEARGSAPIRLALLPIAPYKVNTLPSGNHIDPDEAVTAFRQLDAAYALGVHWGTFEIGPEPIDGAPKRLADALVAKGIDASRFRTMEPGRSWVVPRAAPPS
jgi:L-ascorbate metabolism protein UlaG (beta-lactamase superfamily)